MQALVTSKILARIFDAVIYYHMINFYFREILINDLQDILLLYTNFKSNTNCQIGIIPNRNFDNAGRNYQN